MSAASKSIFTIIIAYVVAYLAVRLGKQAWEGRPLDPVPEPNAELVFVSLVGAIVLYIRWLTQSHKEESANG